MVTTSPGAVLDQHRQLQERTAHPAVILTQSLRFTAEELVKTRGEEVALAQFAPYRPQDSNEEAAKFYHELSQSLITATSYQVTEEMVDAITGAYQQAQGAGHLDLQEMPSEEGFVWLDKPWQYKSSDGGISSVRVVTWHRVAVRSPRWRHMTDPWHEQFAENDLARVRSAIGDLMLSTTSLRLFSIPFLGHDESNDSLLTWFHTLWMFLGMEIVSSQPTPVDRHSRRRAERSSIKHHEVNVVRLRRVNHADGQYRSPEAREVEWSVQWLVRGHWRHLESYNGARHHAVPVYGEPGDHRLCATCDVPVTWVRPYIKGPDGKPLKITDQLFKLAR